MCETLTHLSRLHDLHGTSIKLTVIERRARNSLCSRIQLHRADHEQHWPAHHDHQRPRRTAVMEHAHTKRYSTCMLRRPSSTPVPTVSWRVTRPRIGRWPDLLRAIQPQAQRIRNPTTHPARFIDDPPRHTFTFVAFSPTLASKDFTPPP